MAYSEKQKKDIIDSICKKIEKGMALRNILKEKKMPEAHTFYSWIDADEKKLQQYVRAKELYAEFMFDDIVSISDGTNDDVLKDENGVEQINYNIIQRDRLRVDARKWALSKLNPKKYGEKSTTILEGGEKPIHISFED